ncbi:hypothetical protein NIES2119_31690 [[Phormidium ambiguum] IAM M-71]|uniref:Uncharacterized protein n=1 Tax=[Phormidium ambiguum] IAM M-71 TaxID=454136 RepID=A0A1U7I1Y3_9CYAN|nr:hypothetical protein [Phormidium ambiguum]OKH30040.1 hypothetical protein NIES2119_31690 [Phormidium ambiguum IAM M-71]
MTDKPKNDWVKLGEKLAQKLDGVIDEAEIRTLAIDAINQVIEAGITLKRPLTQIRKEVEARFPTMPTTEVKPDGYYFTNTGQGRVERFEHLALWYLTQNTDRRNVTGDDARKQYWQGLPKFGKETETSETSQKPTQKATEKPTKTNQPTLTTKMLETAVIDALELDEETKEILDLALTHSGLDLAEFMQKAIKTYANTITGKIRRLEEDSLENISTSELLTNPKYSTYPGRAEEMVRRAIQAIKIYNSEVATEAKQRWIITQSLLSELTGSRGSVVQSAMQKYRDDIDSHHQKYPEFFNEDGTLKQYFNRKRGVEIRDEIDLVKLVPNE